MRLLGCRCRDIDNIDYPLLLKTPVKALSLFSKAVAFTTAIRFAPNRTSSRKVNKGLYGNTKLPYSP